MSKASPRLLRTGCLARCKVESLCREGEVRKSVGWSTLNNAITQNANLQHQDRKRCPTLYYYIKEGYKEYSKTYLEDFQLRLGQKLCSQRATSPDDSHLPMNSPV